MDLAPTEEQLAVQRTAREFATHEVLPKAAEIDREHRHPAELVKRMAELGFLGIAVHLRAHLLTAALLRPEQIEEYYQFRGYIAPSSGRHLGY